MVIHVRTWKIYVSVYALLVIQYLCLRRRMVLCSERTTAWLLADEIASVDSVYSTLLQIAASQLAFAWTTSELECSRFRWIWHKNDANGSSNDNLNIYIGRIGTIACHLSVYITFKRYVHYRTCAFACSWRIIADSLLQKTSLSQTSAEPSSSMPAPPFS